jgi:hypothetical protein
MKQYITEAKRMQKLAGMVTEIKAGSVKVGAEYTLMAQLGKLNNGDKVKVDDVEAYGNDVKITLVNQDGVSDFFILDRNDDFELN